VWGEHYHQSHCAQAQQLTSPTRLPGAVAIILGAIITVLGLGVAAGATKPNPEHKIMLCHRTDSYSNPYVVITVDVASVKFEGHDGHNGPVFFPDIPKHQKWGDIIPPFDFGANGSYPGKNWTPAGIAIFDHQCAVMTPTTTTTPGTTTPSSTTPGSTTPGSTTPGTTTPSSTTPGSTTPGTTTPGSTTPGSTTPGTSTPGSSIEGTSITTTGQGTSATQGAGAASDTTTGVGAPLAFTGGREWGLVLLGVAMTLAGVAIVLRRRATFPRT